VVAQSSPSGVRKRNNIRRRTRHTPRREFAPELRYKVPALLVRRGFERLRERCFYRVVFAPQTLRVTMSRGVTLRCRRRFSTFTLDDA
jgi:hypothetical protein